MHGRRRHIVVIARACHLSDSGKLRAEAYGLDC
jgi:hypothetical protein